MTFGDLHDAGCHDIDVVRLAPEAQERLRAIGRGDWDSLYSLRLAGGPRVWAQREFTRLNVLWWDPRHAVYPVEKKHT